MPSTITRFLLIAATLLGGALAGGVLDRVIVGGPAWHTLGADAWVSYSRQADLGTGLVAYPVEGIGTALLLIFATVSHYRDGNVRHRATLALSLAVALSLSGLLLTVKAAPIMLSLKKSQSNGAVQAAFNGFFFWGLYLRGAVNTLAFVAEVWALSTFIDTTKRGPRRRADAHS